ncbi:MAG: hypothetical protein IIB66_03415, partial [Proteobacteria bacterium]|nr:hypothetical protein [Pseudomonadota bacterium]
MKLKKLVASVGILGVLASGTAIIGAPAAHAQDCGHTVGAVLSLTGSYGAFGVPISKAAEMGVEQVEEANGVANVTYEELRLQTWLEELFDDPGGLDELGPVVGFDLQLDRLALLRPVRFALDLGQYSGDRGDAALDLVQDIVAGAALVPG